VKTNKNKNYIYKNDLFHFESFAEKFSSKLFDEFNTIANEICINQQIEDLINGKIVNFSENQAAWHPKYRKDGPKTDNYLRNYILKFLEKKERVNIVIIGIGGSYEGPKLLVESLRAPYMDDKYHYEFITGSDLSEFKYKISNFKQEETIFIISSKSFKTDETIAMFNHASKWSKKIDHFIAITSNICEAKKYGFSDDNIIHFDKEIGGRYSIWSQVAEVPLMDGTSFKSFLEGGHQADQDILNDANYLEFLKRLSFSDLWLNNNANKNIRVILSYVWLLRSLPEYFQQLEMESLGKKPNPDKKYKHTGQVIFGGYGPSAQHSYFQLLHQGSQEICADIIASREDKKSLAYAQAVIQSKLLSNAPDNLKEDEKINGNVPVNLFLLNKIDPFTLGYLIASWEYRTFISATMLKINPFDQFGVNAGKIYTKRYLADKN